MSGLFSLHAKADRVGWMTDAGLRWKHGVISLGASGFAGKAYADELLNYGVMGTMNVEW